jgi:hypothetical protein
MPDQKERMKPQGNPLDDEVPDPNPAQRQSDAAPDVIGEHQVAVDGTVIPPVEHASTANGIPPFDEADGEIRRKLYEKGAALVSRID